MSFHSATINTSIRGAPIKSKLNKGLYQLVPNQARLTWIASGTFNIENSERAAPRKKEPTNDKRSVSKGFFILRMPLPRRLPITESTIIAPIRKRILNSPDPLLPVLTDSEGKVIAPARDRRNNKRIITSAFIARVPKFMLPPKKIKCRLT